MYTFQDLLNYFEDRPEIQEQLIANTSQSVKDYVSKSLLAGVLSRSFAWRLSPEGYDYWHDLMLELLNDSPQAP